MGRGSSSIPEGVGAWAGELPFHTWTEGQTCQVLDIIASNASYSRAYTRQRMDRRDQYRIEKKLCLQVLKDTEWMNWMIRHNLVTRNTQGVLQAKDGWDKHHLAISRLLKALREPALAIKGVLGTVTNPAQLMAGTQAHYLWSQWQSTGKNTWYFKYLALLLKRNPSWLEVTTANVSFDTRRTLSFANPTSIDQGNSNTERNKRALSRRSYQSKSKTTSPSSTSIAESRIPNSVDERVSFSTFVDLEGPNNSPDPPGIQPSQAQIASTSTGNLTNKPEAALLIPSLTKTGPQSDTISIKNGDTEISSHFNQQMFILETLDDVEPTKDINPLQLSTNCSSSPDNSPAVEATVLQIGDGDNPRDTERREIGRYSSELVSSLLDIIINEVGHRSSACMRNIEICDSGEHLEIGPKIIQLITDLGGNVVKRYSCGNRDPNVKRFVLHDCHSKCWVINHKNASAPTGYDVITLQGLVNLIIDLRKAESDRLSKDQSTSSA